MLIQPGAVLLDAGHTRTGMIVAPVSKAIGAARGRPVRGTGNTQRARIRRGNGPGHRIRDPPEATRVNDCHEVYAVKYAQKLDRFRRDNFIEAVYEDRVVFHDTKQRIAPGVSVHHIGGHTPGMQSVRVNTARGQVVLASDAAHYYENFLDRRPYPTVCRVDEMVLGWDTLQRLADSPRHVVPGHDPQVLQHYRAGEASLAGIVARLHEPPAAG
jgi:glyoxylase-like metal-dependent hydrolase (beta-lactamase superfamily II)